MNIYTLYDGEAEAVECATAESWQAAGQHLADSTGCVYVFTGKRRTKVQDCECPEPREACPDSDNGTEPCVFREGVEVWEFDAYMEPGEATDHDIGWNDQDPNGPEVFRPVSKAAAS